MNETSPDFGTGLRAHLGLDAAQLELAAEPVAPPLQPVAELVEDEVGVDEVELKDTRVLDALAALEGALLERERSLAAREANLANRAGSLLATAQALYDEVLGSGSVPQDDELSRMRRRKSVA
jgi:hypothetical protein